MCLIATVDGQVATPDTLFTFQLVPRFKVG
jgi:hypothetical protein